jgi:ABC-type proline/glycine betaine transport system substrate-binding protein
MKSFKTFNEGYASNDPKVKAIAKKFKKDIKDVRRGYMYLEIGDKLYDAVYAYLSNIESGNWKDPDFAWEKVSDFIHDMSKFGLGKV